MGGLASKNLPRRRRKRTRPTKRSLAIPSLTTPRKKNPRLKQPRLKQPRPKNLTPPRRKKARQTKRRLEQKQRRRPIPSALTTRQRQMPTRATRHPWSRRIHRIRRKHLIGLQLKPAHGPRTCAGRSIFCVYHRFHPIVFGIGIASTVARTAHIGYYCILRKTLCCPWHPSPRHGHTTPFTPVSSITTVGRAEPFGLVQTHVMPCGEKGAMDRHSIRLGAGTSSQHVPVRAHASGGPNTFVFHTTRISCVCRVP